MPILPVEVQLTVEEAPIIPLGLEDQDQAELGVSESVNPVIPTSYNALYDKPKLNGVTIEGNHDSAYYGVDQTYTHQQTVASAEWTIAHNLHKYPSVTVVDSAGSVVVGGVQYLSLNDVVITFSGPFSGTAYLN